MSSTILAPEVASKRTDFVIIDSFLSELDECLTANMPPSKANSSLDYKSGEFFKFEKLSGLEDLSEYW